MNITGKIPDNGNTKGIEIAVLLKYLSRFWRTLEIHLINCEINHILKCSSICVITISTGAEIFVITYAKLYVLVVTSSTQDNAKLLEQSTSGFKQAINWDKYLSKMSIWKQNQYLDYLIDIFQGVNRLFILSFEDNALQRRHIGHHILNVRLQCYDRWRKNL